MNRDTFFHKHYKTDDLLEETVLLPGDWIESQSGSWHLVLRILGTGHVQDGWNGKFGTQTRNDSLSNERIIVFDGHFINKRSREEINRSYRRVYSPNKLEPEKYLFRFPL
jgi:hypothetical protein